MIPIAPWALVRIFGLEEGGLLTSLMFFTPYAAIAALLVAGVAVALRNWAAAALAAVATACLMAAVLPRAIGSETESAAVTRRFPSSRFPLAPLPRQTHFLFRMPRAVVALPDGRRLRLVAVHPQPPNMSVDRWREALESLPTPAAGIPWVLVGDFNATFDQAQFRDLVDDGYRDAGDATGNGLEPTWPGPDKSPSGLITVDHVLADRRIGVAEYGVEDLSGSDHRAVHARLVLP